MTYTTSEIIVNFISFLVSWMSLLFSTCLVKLGVRCWPIIRKKASDKPKLNEIFFSFWLKNNRYLLTNATKAKIQKSKSKKLKVNQKANTKVIYQIPRYNSRVLLKTSSIHKVVVNGPKIWIYKVIKKIKDLSSFIYKNLKLSLCDIYLSLIIRFDEP